MIVAGDLLEADDFDDTITRHLPPVRRAPPINLIPRVYEARDYHDTLPSDHTPLMAGEMDDDDKCKPGEGGGIAVPLVILMIIAAIAAAWQFVALVVAR